MAQKKKTQVSATKKQASLKRTYVESTDPLVFYSDHMRLAAFGPEVHLQFFETIPGPTDGAEIEEARTHLRANVIVSPEHAQQIGKVLSGLRSEQD